jgi:hypothetical protein
VLAQHRNLGDGRILNMGEIFRREARFTVTANSPTRLAGLEGMLRAAAPGAVELDRHTERLYEDTGGRPGRTIIFETYFVEGADDEARANTARAAEADWLDTPGVVGDLSPREASASGNPADLAELRSVVNDIEYNLLKAAERDGRPTEWLMDTDRLRTELQLEA